MRPTARSHARARSRMRSKGCSSARLEAFRAEMAEIILFGSEENPSLRTLLGPGNYRELMEPVDSEVADAMRDLLERSAGRASRSIRPFGGARLQRYLEARGVTHAMVAPLPGRGARDRRDHARQPLRGRALVRPRRPAAARHARRQRQRRAPVRPPRAGRQPAVAAPGAAPPPGLPRPAHEPCQPLAVHRRGEVGDCRRAAASSLCCSSTSTTSRRSTTASAIPPATSCWCRSPRACVPACGPRT